MAGPASEAWDTCHCAVDSALVCVDHICTLCGSGPDEPLECGDGGVIGYDSGIDYDGSIDYEGGIEYDGSIEYDGGVIPIEDGGVSPPGTVPRRARRFRERQAVRDRRPRVHRTLPVSPSRRHHAVHLHRVALGCEIYSCPPQPACAVGAVCAQGETCTMTSAGPCGSDVLLYCADTDQGMGAYKVQSFPCSSGGVSCGWGGTGGCSESCTCQNDSMVCKRTAPTAARVSRSAAPAATVRSSSRPRCARRHT